MGGIVSGLASERKDIKLVSKNTRLNLDVDEYLDPKRPITPGPEYMKQNKLNWRENLQDVGVYFPEDEPAMLQQTKDLVYEPDEDEDDEEYEDEGMDEDEMMGGH
mmetsp:Transcript_43455/g.108936  ORF Transcript_43455/g.108936 Transcript_43455/m.108936 type:complete len:105 (+) Transcript_43455:211-525(+)